MIRSTRRRLLPGCVLAAAVAAALGCVIDYQLGEDRDPRFVRVLADRTWTDAGVDVVTGDRVEVEYLRGMWSPWPGGSYDAIGSGGDPRCDCNRLMGVSHAALIGRVGEGDPFLVGARWESVVGESGRLLLGMNDSRLDDNSGWLEVQVTVGR